MELLDTPNPNAKKIVIDDNNNLNEVNVISKKINKLGFFEKLFHIFS